MRKNIHKLAYIGDLEGVRDILNASDESIINKTKDIVSNYKYTKGILFLNVTPLHLACQEGKHKLVKFMLERGADPNIIMTNTKNKEKLNAYEVGIIHGRPRSWWYLIHIKKNGHLLLN